MEPTNFPPNSMASKTVREEKNLSPVVEGEVRRKKKSLGRRFSEAFVGGDLKTSVQFVIFDIFLPGARDMIFDVVQGGFEKLIFGDTRRRGATPPVSGQTGVMNYRGMFPGNRPMLSSPQRAMSRIARSNHDFDEIVLDTRSEAYTVLDSLVEVISQHGEATVADLYQLLGLNSNHQDLKWGWTDIRGFGVSRHRDGFVLDLPDPHPIDN